MIEPLDRDVNPMGDDRSRTIDFTIAVELPNVPSAGSARFYAEDQWDEIIDRYGEERNDRFQTLANLTEKQLADRHRAAKLKLEAQVRRRFSKAKRFDNVPWGECQAAFAWMGYVPRDFAKMEAWARQFSEYEPLADKYLDALNDVRAGAMDGAFQFPVSPEELIEWAQDLEDAPAILTVVLKEASGVSPGPNVQRPKRRYDVLRSSLSESRREVRQLKRQLRSNANSNRDLRRSNQNLNTELMRWKKVNVDRLRAALYLFFSAYFPPSDNRSRKHNVNCEQASRWLAEQGMEFPPDIVSDVVAAGMSGFQSLSSLEPKAREERGDGREVSVNPPPQK